MCCEHLAANARNKSIVVSCFLKVNADPGMPIAAALPDVKAAGRPSETNRSPLAARATKRIRKHTSTGHGAICLSHVGPFFWPAVS